MSATSGIGVAPGLTEAWTSALSDKGVRFVLIGIEKESLVHDKTIRGTHGSLDADIALLANEVQPDVPAYILGRIADSTWLAISYVPDIAKIRDKMLYASTRGALTKALGATYFPSSLFLTSKAELVPGAYASLLKSQSAPLPYSEREKDALAVREAERAAGASYEGARARVSPLQHSKGFKVADDVHDAIESLGAGGAEGGRLVILNVDVEKEMIVLSSSESCSSSDLASKLPSSTPCYAFFSHPLPNVPYTVFVYSCPSTSPIKQRMLYASNTLMLSNSVKSILESSSAPLHPRRIETSEPSSLDVAFLTHELVDSPEAKAFARSQSALASRSNSTAGGVGGATGRGGGEGEVEEGGNVSSVRGAIAAMEARARDASAEMPSNTGFARPKGPGRKR